MATTKSRQGGEAAVTKAVAERERWESALAAALDEAAAVTALVPDSVDDLDRVGQATAAAHGRAEAARRGLARAAEQEAAARRDLLHRVADDTAADRLQVERDVHALDRKIAPLLRSLQDLDGVDYGPAPKATYADGATVPASEADLVRFGSYTVPVSRRARLGTQVRELLIREAVLRFVADHGQSPANGRALIGSAPIPDESTAIARAGLAFPFGWNPVPLPEEAAAYLAWLHPAPADVPKPEEQAGSADDLLEDADAFEDLADLLGEPGQ